jgi:hypothetical protein
MARDSQRLEQEFIANCRQNTGRDLAEWLEVIGATGLDKPNAILKWLKDEHKLNHLQASKRISYPGFTSTAASRYLIMRCCSRICSRAKTTCCRCTGRWNRSSRPI